jgi:hypothetical protein
MYVLRADRWVECLILLLYVPPANEHNAGTRHATISPPEFVESMARKSRLTPTAIPKSTSDTMIFNIAIAVRAVTAVFVPPSANAACNAGSCPHACGRMAMQRIQDKPINKEGVSDRSLIDKGFPVLLRPIAIFGFN